MNKKILSLALVLAVSVFGLVGSFATPPGSRVAPADQRGNPMGSSDYGGYSSKRNSSTGEMVVCSGRCLLAGLLIGTSVNGSPVQLRIRNTSAAEGSGVLVGQFPLYAVNTNPNTPIQRPILLDKGITASLSSASNGEEVIILYLDMD